jgi:nicotinamidase-related amidase
MAHHKSRTKLIILGLTWSLFSPPLWAQGILGEWSSVPTPSAPALESVAIESAHTALLVLDVTTHTCNMEVRPRCVAMLPKVKALLAKTRAKGVFTVYALGLLPTPGMPSDIWPEAAMVGNEPFVRSGPDKFLNTALEQILKDHAIQTVIVIGTASHGAVLYTVGGSVFRGLKVIVPVDAVSAESTYAEQYTLWHLKNAPRMAANVRLTSVDLLN